MVLQKSEPQLRKILSKDPLSINQRNKWGQTPLHLAVVWPFGVSELLKNGADVDALDDMHWSPLTYALEHGFAETVNHLMVAGCSLQGSKYSLL